MCAIKGVWQLDLATDSQLVNRQSSTRVKHVRNWRITIARALQDKMFNLVRQLTHDSNSRLVPLARLSHHNALFGWKLTFHIPQYTTINILIHRKCRKLSRENFKRETLEKNKNDSSTIFIIWFSKFLYSHPLHWHILERYILPNPYLIIPILVRRYFDACEAVRRRPIYLIDAMGLLQDPGS